jgi:hypothetical protein
MNDSRLQLAEQADKSGVLLDQMPSRLVQRPVHDTLALDPRAKFLGNISERDDRMAPFLRRQPIHQVDNTVFQPANAKAVNDVSDQWPHGRIP